MADKLKFEDIEQKYLNEKGEVVDEPAKAYQIGFLELEEGKKTEYATGQVISFKTGEGTEYNNVVIVKIQSSKLVVEDDEYVQHHVPLETIELESMNIEKLNKYQLKELEKEAEEV